MQEKRLSKNQKRCQKKLLQEIKEVKQIAKNISRGIPHKQVKIATKLLKDLYNQPRFRENQNFLLRRYTKLEKGDILWLNLVVPFFISVFVTVLFQDSISTEINAFFRLTIDAFKGSVTVASGLLDYQTIVTLLLGWVFLLGFVIALIYEMCKFFKIVADSLTRSPESTIIENELCIIRVLLYEHGVLLHDEMVYEINKEERV